MMDTSFVAKRSRQAQGAPQMTKTMESTSLEPNAATAAALALFADTVNEAWQACSPLVSVVVLLDLGDELNSQVSAQGRTLILNRTDSLPVRTLASHLDLTTRLSEILIEGLSQIAKQILGQIAEGIDALSVIEQTRRKEF